MPGTIDSATTRKHDEDVERAAKKEQARAEAERAEKRAEGPVDQAPGEMPPEHGERRKK